METMQNGPENVRAIRSTNSLLGSVSSGLSLNSEASLGRSSEWSIQPRCCNRLSKAWQCQGHLGLGQVDFGDACITQGGANAVSLPGGSQGGHGGGSGEGHRHHTYITYIPLQN